MSFHNLHRIHRITHFLYETKDVKYDEDDEEEKTFLLWNINVYKESWKQLQILCAVSLLHTQ